MADRQNIETVRSYLRTIPKELGVRKAYLFGSFAKGNEREESDIDIALVLADMPDFFAVQNQLMRLRRTIDLRIEPHPISEKDFTSQHPLAAEIAITGIEVTA